MFRLNFEIGNTMSMRMILWLIMGLFVAVQTQAQSTRKDIRAGNREYRAENYQDAERKFREALEADPQNTTALYNLANSLYKQGRYEEAANLLNGLTQMDISRDQKADAFHNLGNAHIGQQQIQEGIEAYKNSLRIRPEDMDTRHNLTYALQLLDEQQQEQQQQDEDSQDQDQDQEQDQQPQPDPDQDQQEQEQQPQPRPDQISPEDAERILDALNQQEQEIQEKIEREEKERRPTRPEREW